MCILYQNQKPFAGHFSAGDPRIHSRSFCWNTAREANPAFDRPPFEPFFILFKVIMNRKRSMMVNDIFLDFSIDRLISERGKRRRPTDGA